MPTTKGCRLDKCTKAARSGRAWLSWGCHPHLQCIGTESEWHTCINVCIQFNIIETFVKLTIILESYKHFHIIEVHEGCFIISTNTVLIYFCLTDRAEPFRTKRSRLILYIIKISALSVRQKYEKYHWHYILSYYETLLCLWKKTNVHVLAKQIIPDCSSSQGLSEYV